MQSPLSSQLRKPKGGRQHRAEEGFNHLTARLRGESLKVEVNGIVESDLPILIEWDNLILYHAISLLVESSKKRSYKHEVSPYLLW